jgi:hypothetical protein
MSPNSQPRIPTRVCQGRVVTADLPTLGTNPKQPQSESETQGAKDLTTFRSTRRTVRKHRADRPRGLGGLSAGCGRPFENNSRTTSTTPSITDRPPSTRGPFTPHGLSGLSSRTDRQTLCNQKHTAKRIEMNALKNTRRTRRTPGQLPPRGLSAPTRLTVRHVRTDAGTAGREQERKLPTSYPSKDLPNGLSS